MPCVMGPPCAWKKYVWALSSALVLGSLIGFGGCKKQVATEEPPPEEPPAATPAPTPATPALKPLVITTPPLLSHPSTPAPELAPPGVFYLVTAVSVETSDGILGLKPGQPLREVRSGVYLADNSQVTLRPDQVTNDLAVARRLAAQEQKNQAAIQQRWTATTATTTPAANSSASLRVAPTPTPQNANASIRAELLRKKALIIQQTEQVAQTLGAVSNRYGNWEAAAKKSPQAATLFQQFKALQQQRADVEAQIAQLR